MAETVKPGDVLDEFLLIGKEIFIHTVVAIDPAPDKDGSYGIGFMKCPNCGSDNTCIIKRNCTYDVGYEFFLKYGGYTDFLGYCGDCWVMWKTMKETSPEDLLEVGDDT